MSIATCTYWHAMSCKEEKNALACPKPDRTQSISPRYTKLEKLKKSLNNILWVYYVATYIWACEWRSYCLAGRDRIHLLTSGIAINLESAFNCSPGTRVTTNTWYMLMRPSSCDGSRQTRKILIFPAKREREYSTVIVAYFRLPTDFAHMPICRIVCCLAGDTCIFIYWPVADHKFAECDFFAVNRVTANTWFMQMRPSTVIEADRPGKSSSSSPVVAVSCISCLFFSYAYLFISFYVIGNAELQMLPHHPRRKTDMPSPHTRLKWIPCVISNRMFDVLQFSDRASWPVERKYFILFWRTSVIIHYSGRN